MNLRSTKFTTMPRLNHSVTAFLPSAFLVPMQERCLGQRTSGIRCPHAPVVGRSVHMTSASSSSSENPKAGDFNSTGPSSSDAGDSGASWQQELRLLLDPSMPSGAKQVLLQDLMKRGPEIMKDACGSSTNQEAGLGGVADVVRQFQKDVLPDLLTNGPRYAAKAAEDFPQTLSNMTSGAGSVGSGLPTSFTGEDAQREFRNIFNKTPEGLFTPSYTVLSNNKGYEIRKYPSIIVAETRMMAGTSVSPATEVESASAMGQSFNNLAGYLFGKNQERSSMKMTTPVIINKGQPQETMSFIIGEYDSVEAVPKSLDDTVILREQPAQTLAVIEFTGFVTQGEAKRQRETLLSMLARDGILLAKESEDAFKCMIYNGPSTLPNLRRNELMVEVIYSPLDQS